MSGGSRIGRLRSGTVARITSYNVCYTKLLRVTGDGVPLGPAILGISVQLLLPFVLGQLLRPHVQDWLARHKALTHSYNFV